MRTSRRSFLKTTASSALAVPFVLSSDVWAAKPNSKITVGCIGMGKQSRGLMGGFMRGDTRVVAVCEVDTTRRENAKARVNKQYGTSGGSGCAAYTDFRKITNRDDIDAVCIATPDHWHAIPILAALRSGKDVYCEKPLTHNIHESIEVIKAVDANKRVLQTGSMQRSMKEFRVACELVRNGAIGKLLKVECSFGDPGKPCDLKEEKMEPGLDWNMWIGPGPMRPYSSVLSPRGMHGHFPHWRNYKEYGGGMVCDWGAHHLDIAQWGIGADDSGPVQVRPPVRKGDKRGAILVYASGVTVEHKSGFGVHFFGTEGEVQVNRGRMTFQRGGKMIASNVGARSRTSRTAMLKKVEDDFLKNAKIKLYVSSNHIGDFVACMKSRKKPITSEQVGGRSAICCHLMNQAYYNHAMIKWDPKKLVLAGGTGNRKWLTRNYRSPWSV